MHLKKFKIGSASKILIQRTYSEYTEGAVDKTVEISSKEEIDQILSLFKKIPKKGDILKRMGPRTLIKVTIFDDSEIGSFMYYDARIQTTDSSFISASKTPPEEKQLYDLLVSLLE